MRESRNRESCWTSCQSIRISQRGVIVRGRRGLYLQPKAQALGLAQSEAEPAVMPVNLYAPTKRHRLGSMTSLFAAEDGTIWSHAISIDACRHAIDPLSGSETSSPLLHDVSISCRGPYQRTLVFVARLACKLAVPLTLSSTS